MSSNFRLADHTQEEISQHALELWRPRTWSLGEQSSAYDNVNTVGCPVQEEAIEESDQDVRGSSATSTRRGSKNTRSARQQANYEAVARYRQRKSDLLKKLETENIALKLENKELKRQLHSHWEEKSEALSNQLSLQTQINSLQRQLLAVTQGTISQYPSDYLQSQQVDLTPSESHNASFQTFVQYGLTQVGANAQEDPTYFQALPGGTSEEP
ncbi:uncharacterized protein L201_007087 [Kwoniella dendrophila CBS 6074]|uniref:BZIP domain-containing protein n=1 Tax=Kwoniella dendrophila CBS 6074 TaxID=1295534 RepID=A0AAX4K4W0_9TREE